MKCPKCSTENSLDSRFCKKCAAVLSLDIEGVSLTKTLETPVQVMKPGSLIAGKYTIIEEIGHGGMGVVYKAEDIKLKRSVALKFLPPHLMDSPELKERFLIEAQAAAALSHPNICVIHEVGESDEQPYIAMEYVEGETLRDRIRRAPLPVSSVTTGPNLFQELWINGPTKTGSRWTSRGPENLWITRRSSRSTARSGTNV